MAEPLVIGDTIDFTATVKKDGATWDITGGTVTLQLKDPTGTVTDYSATGGSGTASYSGDGTELDVSGTWRRRWEVVKSGITVKSRWILFSVID